MLLVTERDGIHLGELVNDGERGELRLGCKPDFYPRQMRIELRRHADSFLVKSLSNATRRTYFACFGRATEGSGESERIDR